MELHRVQEVIDLANYFIQECNYNTMDALQQAEREIIGREKYKL